ncbi:aminoglycoside phosphotransferase [Xylariales sp. PMI_506]|nr:aminoglycoside phosphotransferase [Xylariales sp. PMI_506]
MVAHSENRIIESVTELSVDFLRSALGVEGIVSFETTRIGTGQLGECHRISLHYQDSEAIDGSRPATVVLKIATQSPRSRASGLSLGIYECELRFYTDLAPYMKAATKSIPNRYYDTFDKNTGAFTLILEDAGPKAIVGDDIKGATLEQAQAAMHELGKIHASLIVDPDRASWFAKSSKVSQEFLKQLFSGFQERYKDRLDPSHFEICKTFVERYDAYMKSLTVPGAVTMGIMHGDYRLDNMLFIPRDGGGLDIKVVDWQLVAAAPVVSDLAYFIGGSLRTEDRREWQDSLLQSYCDALDATAGEPVLTVQDCLRDLRLNAFFGVGMCVISSIMASQTERGDNMFMTMLARHCELVKDLNALELLPEPEPVDMTPLRPTAEDEGQHEKGTEKDWNESWYFDFVDKEQGIAGWIRLGLVPNRKGNWYHAAITREGQATVIVADFEAPLPDKELHLQTENLDATHKVLEPLEAFHLSLKGKGYTFSDPESFPKPGEPSEPVELDLRFDTVGIPYRYRITTRYEIPCKITGSLKIGNGTTITLDGVPGQRDHSFGARDWWGMDWVWSAFHLEGGRHFHATHLRLPNLQPIGIGYAQRAGEGSREIQELTCDEVLGSGGLVDTMKMRIRTFDGKDEVEVTVTPRGHTPLELVNDDGRVALFDRAWGDVVLSTGEKGVGWFEWNRNVAEQE